MVASALPGRLVAGSAAYASRSRFAGLLRSGRAQLPALSGRWAPSPRQAPASSPGCGRPDRPSPGWCGRDVRVTGTAGGRAQLLARGGRCPIAAVVARLFAGLRAPRPRLAGLLRAQRPRYWDGW
jgi:hypothetical protein